MSAAKQPMPFVILASGAGTNARVLLEHAQKNPKRLLAKGLISDKASAPALEIAKEFGVPTHVVPPKDDAAMLAVLEHLQPRWALLAGYMRLVSDRFLHFFQDAELGFYRVMNVHPSLLPAYPGLAGYARAFRDGVKVSGVTVHLVDSGLDTGLPILQRAFLREEKDNAKTFEAKGRAIEYEIFSQALDLAAAGRIRLREADGARWLSTEEIL